MDRAEFDSFAETLGLDQVALATGETILPGTLAASTIPAPRARTFDGPGTLPRLELARPGAPASTAELELTSVLGRGGMGVVWAARQRALDRTVAVKRLGEPPFGAKETESLLAEARTTGAIEHPAIVPVHELGIDADGSPLLVMKRVEGTTLGDLIEDDASPAWAALERRHGDRLAAVLEILMRVADALELAHERGYVHRDVKADNVMVGVLGEVYLLDWGVALRRKDAEGRGREIVGTPGYMAPEMVRGDAREIDARTDVYLLGATLFHALAKRPRHDGATLTAVLYAAMLSEPPEVPAGVPEELGALARRSTAADPAERPASAAAFRDALAQFLRHRASLALADRAIDTLGPLDGAGAAALSAPDATRTLTEARFALTRALEDWPENERARAALDRALRGMIEVELARKSPGAARALARELSVPDAALDARAAALEATLAEEAALAETARNDLADRDPTRGGRARTWLAFGLAVTTAVVIGTVVTLGGGIGRIAYGPAFFIDVALVALMGATMFFLRRRLAVNRWSRNSMAHIFVTMCASCLSHGLGWLRGDDLLLRGDAPSIALFALSFAIAALFLTPRMWIGAAVASVAAIGCAIWPGASLLGTGVTVTVGCVILAYESRGRQASV